MEKLFSVLQVIVPIFTVVSLGMYARRHTVLKTEQVQGLQQFVTQFCLPCILFNSCLSATVEKQSIISMVFASVTVFCGALLSIRLKKKYKFHSLPMLFASQESGMLGIPLFLTLFGTESMYRMGVLDVAQSFIGITTIILLSIDIGESASVSKILRSVIRSPLLIASLCGLCLNLTGAIAWLNKVGLGPVLTETTSFLAQPVSAAMLFSVGYNFSLGAKNRKTICRISAIHLGFFGFFGILTFLTLKLFTIADSRTLWAVVLYWTLPGSYLSPSLARGEDDAAMAAGVCSVLTVICLAVFCVAAVVTA